MRKFKFDKLIRDNMYKKMLKNGAQVICKPTKSKEILSYYKAKLQEEAGEVNSAVNQQELLEELGDCLEVIYGLTDPLGIDFQQIDAIRKKKLAQEAGSSGGL